METNTAQDKVSVIIFNTEGLPPVPSKEKAEEILKGSELENAEIEDL